jgi:hypothetical protein
MQSRRTPPRLRAGGTPAGPTETAIQNVPGVRFVLRIRKRERGIPVGFPAPPPQTQALRKGGSSQAAIVFGAILLVVLWKARTRTAWWGIPR